MIWNIGQKMAQVLKFWNNQRAKKHKNLDLCKNI